MKEAIFFATLIIITKQTPNNSNALRNNKNLKSNKRHENASQGIFSSFVRNQIIDTTMGIKYAPKSKKKDIIYLM